MKQTIKIIKMYAQIYKRNKGLGVNNRSVYSIKEIQLCLTIERSFLQLLCGSMHQ